MDAPASQSLVVVTGIEENSVKDIVSKLIHAGLLKEMTTPGRVKATARFIKEYEAGSKWTRSVSTVAERSHVSRARGKGEKLMPDEEVEQGKRVVAGIISRLCTENGATITKPVSWYFDFNRRSYWLTVEIDGQEKKWQLSEEAITDSVADLSRRKQLARILTVSVIPDPSSRPSIAVSTPTAVSIDPKHDVFVCHASEDKTFVDSLVSALKKAGINVWYDKDMMTWGDDLRPSIDRGLVNSKYGLVVFSKAFLKKKRWTEHELNGLFAKERAGVKVILPIWHNITQEDLVQYSPAFADRLAMDSTKDSLDDIVQNLKKLLGKAPAR